jgi:hypothetical protein
MVILLAYLIFAIGYLEVQGFDITKLFEAPEKLQEGGYYMVIDEHLLRNADIAMSWAFNIPRGWHTGFRDVSPGMIGFLKLFRTLVIAGAALLILSPQRTFLLLGAAWFFVTITPALPLLEHFLPYYLFLPMVGVALFIGTIGAGMYDRLGRVNRILPAITIGGLLTGMLYICSSSIQADIRKHRALGGSADLALMSLSDLKSLYTDLPPDTTIYWDDSQVPLYWDQSWGGLIRMAYGRSDVSVLYSSLGDVISPELVNDRTIVLRYHNGHLADDTEAFREDPSPFMAPKNSSLYRLTVSATEVVAGVGYTLQAIGISDVDVRIAYRLDDGPLQSFSARLDREGRVEFDVSHHTRKGLYRFVGFTISGQRDWFRTDATLLVR